MNFLLVFVGAGLGGMLRHAVNMLTLRWFGPNFPWGTFLINITGSIAMGLVVGFLAHRNLPGTSLRLFVATGVLGGYTTFSTFSLDTIALWERGEAANAIAYVFGSLLFAFAGLWLGMAVFRR
jgi:fluoride exporter